MSVYPSHLLVSSTRYRLETVPVAPRFRLAWDDENPDYGYKSRTQAEGWSGPDNPPAVMRYYPLMREGAGDFRVDLSAWKNAIVVLNGNDEQKFDYLTGPQRALYNNTGWPKQAYISMSGNYLDGERFGDWFRFKTLIPSDVGRVAGWTIDDHPCYVHRFTCVTYDGINKVTKHIESTGTPRGQVYFYLVTNEGFAYVPWRHVIQE